MIYEDPDGRREPDHGYGHGYNKSELHGLHRLGPQGPRLTLRLSAARNMAGSTQTIDSTACRLGSGTNGRSGVRGVTESWDGTLFYVI